MRESIRIFAEKMEEKLQRDDTSKPPWETEHLTDLFHGLLNEVEELADAEDPERKMLECCDVALFSMMLFSKLHPDTQHLVRGRNPDPSPFAHGDPDGMPSDRTIMRNKS